MAEFTPSEPYNRVFTGERRIGNDDLMQAGITSARRRGVISVFTTAPETSFTIQAAVTLSGYRSSRARDVFKDARRAFNSLSQVYDWGEIAEVGIAEQEPGPKEYQWLPSQLPDFEDPSDILFAHIATGVPGNVPLEALGLSVDHIPAVVGRVASQFIGEGAVGVHPDMRQRALRMLSLATLQRPSSVLDAATVLSTGLNNDARRGRPDVPGKK